MSRNTPDGAAVIEKRAILEEALRRAAAIEWEALPDDDEIDWTFSPEFEKKMQRLIADPQTACRPRRGRVSKARVAAACFAAALLAVCLMAVTAVREPVHNLIITPDGIDSQVELKKEYALPGGKIITPPKGIETFYLPTAIPEGYTLKEMSTVYHTASWKNEKNEIYFSQAPASVSSTIDTWNAEVVEIVVNGHAGILARNVSQSILVWDNYGYLFELIYPAEIADSEILAMAESLEAQ